MNNQLVEFEDYFRPVNTIYRYDACGSTPAGEIRQEGILLSLKMIAILAEDSGGYEIVIHYLPDILPDYVTEVNVTGLKMATIPLDPKVRDVTLQQLARMSLVGLAKCLI